MLLSRKHLHKPTTISFVRGICRTRSTRQPSTKPTTGWWLLQGSCSTDDGGSFGSATGTENRPSWHCDPVLFVALCVNQTVIAVVNYEERLSACVEACCGSIVLDARKGHLLVSVRWSYRGFKATSAPPKPLPKPIPKPL